MGGREGKKEGCGCGALSSTMHNYAEVATMHGVYYAFETKYGRLSSFFWILVCIGLITMAAWLITKTYLNWQNNLITTTVKTTGLPVRDVPFPAITICGLGSIEEVMADTLYWQAIEYIKDKKKNPNYEPGKPEEYGDPSCANEWWWLLEDEGLEPEDFLQLYFPNLENDPANLFSVLVARNPDSILLSEYAFDDIEGGSDCNATFNYTSAGGGGSGGSCGASATATTTPAPTGVVTSAADNLKLCGNAGYQYIGGICLMPFDDQRTLDASWEKCSDSAAQLLYLYDSEELTGLKTAITTSGSNIASMKDKVFWVDGLEDASVYGAANYQLSSTVNEDDIDYLCPTMKFDSTLGKFVGDYIDCEATARAICIFWPYDACSDGDDEDVGDINEPFVDKLISTDPDKKQKRDSEKLKRKRQYQTLFNQIDFTQSYGNVFDLLWSSTLPCFAFEDKSDSAMIKKCTWKGVRMPCARLFSMFPTDRGMCCTFNMDAADKMFRQSRYQQLIIERQKFDQSAAATKTALPNWYTKNKEPFPQAGISKGLSLILDAHTDQIASGSVSEDFQGFYAVVDAKNAYPQADQRNIRIRPGYDNLVSLNAISVTSETRIKSVDPEVRNCFFKEEHPLKLYKDYSQASCVLECNIHYVKKNLTATENVTCVPWYLPMNDDSDATMCDPWMAAKFQKLMLRVPDETCSHCLPDCITTSYTASVSSVPFRKCDEKNMGVSNLCDLTGTDVVDPPIYGSDLYKEYEDSGLYNGTDNFPSYVKKKSKSTRKYSQKEFKMFGTNSANDGPKDENEYDIYEKDIAVVHFYFESSSVFQYGRDLRMTTIDFISQVGGLLGLCIGFSLASGVEILYWLTVRFWAETGKKKGGGVGSATDRKEAAWDHAFNYK